jgi:ribonuclease III
MYMSDQDESEAVLIDPPPIDKFELEKLVGTKVNNLAIYQKAFTHKSALKRYTLTESFETLEFMGDTVLGFIITKFLFDRYESKQEGFLTKARTKLVRGNMLASIAKRLALDRWILMDEKGIRNGWNHNEKVLEDVLEALIGAMYIDLGLVHTKKFVLGVFSDSTLVNLDCIMIDDNYKDRLMRYCQANKLNLPEYTVVNHVNGEFCMNVSVNGGTIGRGSAKTKKQAEQQSAYEALIHLQEL